METEVTLQPSQGTSGLSLEQPVEKRRSNRRLGDGWTLQERLATLLSWDEGARTLALKLYNRFCGDCWELPPLLQLLEERWGFPQRLWPLLWAQMRRAVAPGGAAALPMRRIAGVEAPEFISKEQWLEAFTRWLHALQARLGPLKVSRKMMVRRHQSWDVSPEEQYYFQGPKLGEGAYGEVYAMFHRSLGVRRAVKIIHKSRLSVSCGVAEDEVKVLKSLDHPNVIRIYEAFERRETLHIVMDWAEGGTLAAVLSAQRVEGRTVTEAWACSAAQQMCAALAYIHQKGVVHCDLKPENAMLLRAIDVRRNEAPHVLLVDFGIAEIVEARQPAGPLKVRGTAVYLAPEGFEGHLTEKSDLWALGVVIFEMLLGRRPFQADNIAVLWCKVVQSEVPLKELSALSAEVVQGLLNKDPIARLTAQECRSLAWFAQPLHLTEPEEKSARPVKLEGLGSANCFHQIATFAVATGLSMKDMPSVFQVFQSIDQDKSGNLDFEEFRSALARLDITEDPQRLMAILDMDQNGRISYTEFLAAVLSSSMDTVPEKMIQEAFDVFDVDGDGEISLSELRVMMSGDGPLVEVLPNGQTVDEVMEEIAGSKSSISFKDFMKYLSRISRRRRRSSDFAAKHGGDSSQAGMQMVDSMCEELEAEEAEVEEVEEDIPEEDTPEFPALGYTDKEEHPPEVDTEAEETAFWRAFGPSKEHWALKRPQSGGPTALAMPLEGDAGALPPMHEFLLELCGGPRDMEEQRKALNCLLRFPEQKISVEQTDVLAAHISTMNQHFIGGMVLTRLLAEDTPLYELQEKLRQALEAMQIETKPITRRRKEQIAEHEKQEPQVYSPPGSPRTSPPARMSPKSSSPPKESPAPVRLKSRPAESRAWGARLPPQDDFREARLAELRRKQRPPRLRVRQTPSREAPSRGRDYLMDKDTIQEIFLPRLVLGPAKRAVQTGQGAELKPGRSLKPRRAGPTISLRRG